MSSTAVYIVRRCSAWGQRLKESGRRGRRKKCRCFESAQICSACSLTSAERPLGLLLSSGRPFVHDLLRLPMLLHKTLTPQVFDNLQMTFSSKGASKTKQVFCVTMCHSIIKWPPLQASARYIRGENEE